MHPILGIPPEWHEELLVISSAVQLSRYSTTNTNASFATMSQVKVKNRRTESRTRLLLYGYFTATWKDPQVSSDHITRLSVSRLQPRLPPAGHICSLFPRDPNADLGVPFVHFLESLQHPGAPWVGAPLDGVNPA